MKFIKLFLVFAMFTLSACSKNQDEVVGKDEVVKIIKSISSYYEDDGKEGAVIEYEFDEEGKILKNKKFNYTYNPKGYLSVVESIVKNEYYVKYSFVYDDLDRLIQINEWLSNGKEYLRESISYHSGSIDIENSDGVTRLIIDNTGLLKEFASFYGIGGGNFRSSTGLKGLLNYDENGNVISLELRDFVNDKTDDISSESTLGRSYEYEYNLLKKNIFDKGISFSGRTGLIDLAPFLVSYGVDVEYYQISNYEIKSVENFNRFPIGVVPREYGYNQEGIVNKVMYSEGYLDKIKVYEIEYFD